MRLLASRSERHDRSVWDAQNPCFAASSDLAPLVVGEVVAHGHVRRGHLDIAGQTLPLLHDGGAGAHPSARDHVAGRRPDHVAAAQRAVDREVKRGPVAQAFPMVKREPGLRPAAA